MDILQINPQEPSPALLERAKGIILNKGVIGYPTETVYGLGANALDNEAVEKVFRLKGREKDKPILVIASDLDQVQTLVQDFSGITSELAEKFWPGPLTLVLKSKKKINEHLLSMDKFIGIRVPNNELCRQLCKLCKVPVTSTSANISGQANPVTAKEVFQYFPNKLDLILDGGKASSRVPSTVIKVEEKKVILLREGLISKSKIEKIIGMKIDEK